ncbi:MAG: Helix-turn-helix domain [Marmoricola sp.]|nr:Helix-turn-helix domain [Marmoricola sp.]
MNQECSNTPTDTHPTFRGLSAIAVSVRTASQLTEISETTIRDAINKQKLPAYRVGRNIRIKASDLEAWVESLIRVGSDEDLEARKS